MNFQQKLEKRWKDNLYICVGLDSDYSKIPSHLKKRPTDEAILKFNKAIIDKTFDLVCAYKMQSSFYEAEGIDGLKALQKTVQYIRKKHPEIPLILDAKRADIGSTNLGYVKAIFDDLGFDAVTVNPYLGGEALEPFLNRKDKGIIVLVKTSNPKSSEFQNLKVNGKPLYQIVARHVAKKWNKNGNCAVVVGATYAGELKDVRKIIGDMSILIPGIGAQGGDLKETIKNGRGKNMWGMIINNSRGIIFASSDKNFDKAARGKALEMHNQILDIIGIPRVTAFNRSQKKLADLFIATKTKAKVLRRKKEKDGFYFYEHIRETSPIDFPKNAEEFALKLHEKQPHAPLSPIYVNLRNLPNNLLSKICKTLSLIPLDEEIDFCTGIPNTAVRFAKLYSKITKIPFLDIYEKSGTNTNRKMVAKANAPKGNGEKILIIDDVISQGFSKFEAIKVAKDLGFRVSGIMVLIDRSQGGSAILKAKGFRFYSAFSLLSLVSYYAEKKAINKQRFNKIKDYLNN